MKFIKFIFLNGFWNYSEAIIIFIQQKNPGNLAVPGYLTFGHNVPCGTQYILISDYSMIVATRP